MRLTINDNPTEANEGDTLLQLAQRRQIAVPTLCHHESLEPHGSCRLCLVEISNPKWPGWKKLVTSCVYPAQDGLVVKTSTPEIELIRKTLIDLLLARCPQTPTVIALAQEYGLEKSSYQERAEDDQCILCGQCTRVCAEVIGAAAIGTSGRGAGKRVQPAFGKVSEACIGCGACAHVCPTHCIQVTDEGLTRRIPRWLATFDLVPCRRCGKPVSTRKHIEFVRRRTAGGAEVLETCSDCLREFYGRKVAAEGHM